MRLIIAGSRDRHVEPEFIDECLLKNNIDIYSITEVVSGAASGVDWCGEGWAENRPDPIRVRRFPADWDTHGTAAGPIRNKEMALYADVLLAIWDGQSRGTKNMIDHMNRLKKPVFIVKI